MKNRINCTPKMLFANGFWLWNKGYTIECGNCNFSYNDKIPLNAASASSLCPSCDARNNWKHSDFEKQYNNYMKDRK